MGELSNAETRKSPNKKKAQRDAHLPSVAAPSGDNKGKALLRFTHLKERRIVENWVQLKRLKKTQGFPPGRLLGPNTRVWFEYEIDGWLDTRPITREEAIA